MSEGRAPRRVRDALRAVHRGMARADAPYEALGDPSRPAALEAALRRLGRDRDGFDRA